MTRYLIGIDGGGTRTTLALAEENGREILRRTGSPGLVDPRRPAATAEMLTELVREAFAAAGVEGPAASLCAGLAGVGNPTEREIVEKALRRAQIAERVLVHSDGETALHGALGDDAGILLIAGTGSVAYGRAGDGRIERCGGWGMVVGDEGSGFSIGRAALAAALRAVDGRSEPTQLLPAMLEVLGLSSPEAIPPWAGRAEKADIAALAVHALQLASAGDKTALGIVHREAEALATHAAALVKRLGPWRQSVPVVLHGGVARDPIFAAAVEASLAELNPSFEVRPGIADAVTGAVAFARAVLQG